MNFILVIIDSLRKDHIGAYGNDWIKTPNLDEFSEESVRFDRAYPEIMPTIPFRRSLLTGKRVFPCKNWQPMLSSYPYTKLNTIGLAGVPGWTPLLPDETPMAETFSSYGYETVLVTDVLHQFYPSMNFHRGYHSWNWIRGQEWDSLMTNLISDTPDSKKYFTDRTDKGHQKVWELGQYLLNTNFRQSEEDYFAPQVFRTAVKWLEQNHNKEPFFMCIDSFDPHEPWDPPQYYRDMYNPGYNGKEALMPIYTNKASGYLDAEELKHMRALYAGEVTMVDYWFGSFMRKVKQLGLDKNSVIVVVTDHGHQLGEKDFTGKIAYGLMPCLLDLGLFIRHPEGKGAGESVDAFVYNHDILPTVCNLLGEKIPEGVEGEDLWPLAERKRDKIRDYVDTIFKDYVWIRDDNWAMVSRINKTETELFDLKEDPEYLKDVAAENPGVVEKMWELLYKDAGGEIPYHNIAVPLLDKRD